MESVTRIHSDNIICVSYRSSRGKCPTSFRFQFAPCHFPSSFLSFLFYVGYVIQQVVLVSPALHFLVANFHRRR